MKTIDSPARQSPVERQSCLPTSKIKSQHFNQLAIVYVRQSSHQQVVGNRESTARQYALSDDNLLQLNEWWVRDLAKAIGTKYSTLREWALKGWITSRRTKVQKLWIVWADKDELARMKLMQESKSRGIHGYPAEILIPKERPQ